MNEIVQAKHVATGPDTQYIGGQCLLLPLNRCAEVRFSFISAEVAHLFQVIVCYWNACRIFESHCPFLLFSISSVSQDASLELDSTILYLPPSPRPSLWHPDVRYSASRIQQSILPTNAEFQNHRLSKLKSYSYLSNFPLGARHFFFFFVSSSGLFLRCIK